MRDFLVQPARLAGLSLVWPFYKADDRGYFLKRFERTVFEANGIDLHVDEVFESHSEKGVLRGMHFQTLSPQAKLVSCPAGCIFDVAVDLRRNSPTFGQWEGFYLDDDEHCSLYLPAGFAHGFLVVSESARVLYQCDGAYQSGSDTGICWNDADVNIRWPLHLVGQLRLSPRDEALPSLQDCIRANALPEEENP